MKKSKINDYVKSFSPAFFWALLIFFLSHQQMLPSLDLSIADFLLKKTAHMAVYAILYILLIKGFQKLGFQFREIWFKALIICLIYAITDEVHQSFIPGRTGAIRDVGYDMLGASLVALRKFRYI